MIIEAIYHRPYSEYAFIEDKAVLVIRLRTKKDDLSFATLIYFEKYDDSLSGAAVMEKAASDELFDYYEVKVECGIKRIKYMFRLEDKYEIIWYNAQGFHNTEPCWGFFNYSYVSSGNSIDVPEWFKGSIIYQIFPDRFNNPKHVGSEHLDWPEEGNNNLQHYGGNIEGIMEKICYLDELGINTIYLNPIFKAKSYHRYDTIDYYQVDPQLGTSRQLKELVQLCHRRGIRVIIDGVFNHCSSEFFAFKDVLLNGEKSKYKDWFYIKSFPVQTFPKPNYECFSFFGGMPKLNMENKEVIEYFIKVAVFWIQNFDIDGWRFDVADEIGWEFWRRLRNKVKEAKRDAVMIGEIWDEGTPWLNGDIFDSVISYPFKSIITDRFAFKYIETPAFKNRINRHLMQYTSKSAKLLVNIIDSHDTARFITECKNNKKMFELAVVFQFTFPGIPLIYYGDEIGMCGASDPECRMPMQWNKAKWDTELLSLYKFLTGLRKKYEVLSYGEYREFNTFGKGDIIAYRRGKGKGSIAVVMNLTDKTVKVTIDTSNMIKEGASMKSLKNSEIFKVDNKQFKVVLKPYSWNIFTTV